MCLAYLNIDDVQINTYSVITEKQNTVNSTQLLTLINYNNPAYFKKEYKILLASWLYY